MFVDSLQVRQAPLSPPVFVLQDLLQYLLCRGYNTSMPK